MDTIRLGLISLFLLSAFSTHAETEILGNVALELSTFPDTASNTNQSSSYSSAALELEIYQPIGEESSASFKLFSRAGDADKNRNHNDIREALYLTTGETWELRAGITKVYWGVTEANHLVDIINQTDAVESLDGEEKLGQLMLNYTYLSENGNWDFFVLPNFRTRTFASTDGRPSLPLPVKESAATYESSDKENHIDFAIHWSHSVGDWDFGISQFVGTSREAILKPSGFSPLPTFLAPHYEQISQTGLELQLIGDDIIYKAEVINRTAKSGDFSAATLGLESTMVGIYDSDTDLGLLVELMMDSRSASTNNPFQKDIMFGTRIVMNDAQSTEALIGVIVDLDSEATTFSLEASRRLGENFKLNLESRFFSNTSKDPFMKNFKQDGYLKAELAYYF